MFPVITEICGGEQLVQYVKAIQKKFVYLGGIGEQIKSSLLIKRLLQ